MQIKRSLFSGVYLIYLQSLKFIELKNYPVSDWVPLPGGYMPGVPPVPIPNTAVKPRAANGSRTIGPARVGRRQVFDPDAVKSASGSLCFNTFRLFCMPPPAFSSFDGLTLYRRSKVWITDWA